MDRFPPELYREIISHVTYRSDVISLSLASRTLQYEAESILWRIVYIKSYQHRDLIGYFSVLTRVGRHIRSLHLLLQVCSDPDLLHDALQAAINLKSLNIELNCFTAKKALGAKWHLGYLCQGSTFKLRSLFSRLPITQSCQPFFCSQTELVDFDYPGARSCDPQFPYNVFTSPNALPALKSLTTQQTRVIEALLPGRNVTHLSWSNGRFLPPSGLQPAGGPFLTVKVLFIPTEYNMRPPSPTSLMFPNVETIAVRHWEESDISGVIRGFSFLKVARILFSPSVAAYQSAAQLATLLYKSNPLLETVEIWYWMHHRGDDHRNWKWILKRGCNLEEPDPSAYGKVLPSEYSDHHWKTW